MSRILIWGEVRGLSRVRLEGVLRWSAHPLDGAECMWHVQHPAFASEMSVGGFILFFLRGWSFCILWPLNLPQLAHARSYF